MLVVDEGRAAAGHLLLEDQLWGRMEGPNGCRLVSLPVHGEALNLGEGSEV